MSDTDPGIDREQLVQAFGDLGIENVDETVSNVKFALIFWQILKMNLFVHTIQLRGPPLFNRGLSYVNSVPQFYNVLHIAAVVLHLREVGGSGVCDRGHADGGHLLHPAGGSLRWPPEWSLLLR